MGLWLAEELSRCSWATSKGLPALLPGGWWRWGAAGTLGMGQMNCRGRRLRKISLLSRQTGDCRTRLRNEGALSMQGMQQLLYLVALKPCRS